MPLIFLMGPTASGKTDLVIELVKNKSLPVEIISVDSAMVYRGMDIGTGKPSKEELAIVPHHLIDIRDPSDPYSAADFREDALKLIVDITKRGKIPLLVGGTLLYFRALEKGLSPLPSADPIIREKLLKEAREIGWEAMHQRLAKIDPSAANRIHPNDPQRIQRALEVYEITNKPMSELFKDKSLQVNESLQSNDLNLQYKIHSFALVPRDRKFLHDRIAKRFLKMLELGLLEEVKHLFNRGDLHANLPAIRSVGYRQVWQYLAGEISYDDMVLKAMTATRQLAKRQLTWLRSLDNINWLEIENGRLACLKTMINCVS